MKKLIIIFAVISLNLFPQIVYAQSASTPTLSLSPSSGSFNRGCTFNLDIKVDTAGNATDGTDAILIYDPTAFQATAIKNGTIYVDFPGNSTATPGRVTVSGLSSVSSPFTGSGTLATITFTVLPNASLQASQINFDFNPSDKAETTDSNIVARGTVGDILGEASGGTYTVGSGACGTSSGGSTAPVITKTSSQQGGPIDTKQPVSGTEVVTKTLPVSADSNTTILIGIIGGALTVIGIIGLSLL